MATLTVGAGKQYPTIQAAVAAAKAGDTLEVQAGTYTVKEADQIPAIGKALTFKGVGGMAKVQADGWVWNEKGIFVVNADVSFDHFEFANATCSSGNAAGIRHESGALLLTNCLFHDNENGILASPSATATVTIRFCEFHHNGNPNGSAGTHNIYIGDLAKLVVEDSYFHDVTNGYNLLKSRAEVSEITRCRSFDNDSNASYELDFPNGGLVTVRDCVIQQGANSQNSSMVSFGIEGGVHPNSKLTMTGNVFVNEMPGRGALVIGPTPLPPVVMDGNKVWKVDVLTMPTGASVAATNTTTLATKPTLDKTSPIGGAVIQPPPVVVPPPPPPPVIVPPPPPVVDPPPVTTSAPKFGVSMEVQANRILRIDVSEFGVKAADYATRIARKTVTGGCEVTVDGKASVLVKGYSAGDLTTAKFIFAT